MDREDFIQKVIDAALRDEGQEELSGNMGWKDKMFEKAMRAIGWHKGWAWCASWVRKVFLQEAGCYRKQLKKVLTHGVIRTYKNCKYSDLFVVNNVPSRGAIGFLSHGHGKGHEYIVLEVKGDKIKTIEGNTNCDGEREGKYVMIRERQSNPYNLLGYAKLRDNG